MLESEWNAAGKRCDLAYSPIAATSSTEKSKASEDSCPTYPTRDARTRGGREAASIFPNRTRPADKGETPKAVFTNVDFPHPLGPIIPVSFPSGAVRWTPFRISFSPRRTWMFS